MSNSKLKTRINYLIDNVDDQKVLKEIYELLKTKLNEVNEPSVSYIPLSKTAGKGNSTKKKIKKADIKEDYTKPGKPMTMDEFQKYIDKALAGKTTSHEDFLKEMETWD